LDRALLLIVPPSPSLSSYFLEVRDNVRGTYLQVEGQPSVRCTLYAREDTRATNNVERSAIAWPKQRAIAAFPEFPDGKTKRGKTTRDDRIFPLLVLCCWRDRMTRAWREMKIIARAIINGR